MSGLADISLKTEYRKGRDDIADSFYIPCMRRACAFDRAVGFFSSSIYVIAWDALREFISRSGKMRIICSPVLSEEDITALSEGYRKRILAKLSSLLEEEIEALLKDSSRKKPTTVLATLVSLGVIDMRVAIMERKSSHSQRIFHDKLGLFFDAYGNTVAFKGSMNETWMGLSSDGNLESIDVFVSWVDDRDRDRVRNIAHDFNSLWNNEFPSVTVYPFPKAAQEKLLKAADVSKLESFTSEIIEEIKTAKSVSADQKTGGRVPLPHQIQALTTWKSRGRRGILEHATGSGKTFTALCAIRDSLSSGENILILVPSEILLNQWNTEVKETLFDLKPSILLCGGGHTSWKEPGILTGYTRSGSHSPLRVVISTMQTASSDEFIGRIHQGPNLFLVADEVHRLGSPQTRKLLSIETGPRLGLSATPRRAGDSEGTAAILTYFGGVVPPPFTITDAIAAGTLTPYFYYAYSVALNDEEQKSWNLFTDRIRSLCLINKDRSDSVSQEFINNLLIQRARIAKSATGKIPLSTKIITENFREGERWLIYCDSQNQLDQVLHALHKKGIDALSYHSKMDGDRERTLSHFTHNGGILISIKCLDEGVNIPAVDHAIILASSKNPREFIQRRGRILRRYPGKNLAFLFDAIVVPATPDDEGVGTSILLGEIVRAIEFGKGALNKSIQQDLELIALRAGLEYTKLVSEGYEDDGEE